MKTSPSGLIEAASASPAAAAAKSLMADNGATVANARATGTRKPRPDRNRKRLLLETYRLWSLTGR